MALDAGQQPAAEAFARLKDSLARARPGLLARLAGRAPPQPKGLYVWGPVGRGKTMLMDQFYAAAPDLPKRRVHFHAFMQDVHAARSAQRADDVIGAVADAVAATAKLLCLDEMQVTDIADAMILGRLFEALWARRLVIVTTSNQPPDALYKDGLNRQLFLPFIARIKQEMEVVPLADGRDYRLGRLSAEKTYVTPLGPAADQALDGLWDKLADGDAGAPLTLSFLGRKLLVPQAAHACARFSFAELIEQPLGAADYLALAQNFTTLFIDHVRVLKASERNEAKRFILLIDTLYDAGTRLVVSAAAEPEHLCPTGPHKAEFLRTASRLREMQSLSWWQRPV